MLICSLSLFRPGPASLFGEVLFAGSATMLRNILAFSIPTNTSECSELLKIPTGSPHALQLPTWGWGGIRHQAFSSLKHTTVPTPNQGAREDSNALTVEELDCFLTQSKSLSWKRFPRLLQINDLRSKIRGFIFRGSCGILLQIFPNFPKNIFLIVWECRVNLTWKRSSRNWCYGVQFCRFLQPPIHFSTYNNVWRLGLGGLLWSFRNHPGESRKISTGQFFKPWFPDLYQVYCCQSNNIPETQAPLSSCSRGLVSGFYINVHM